MSQFDFQYKELLYHILNHGEKKTDPNREGVYRYQVPFYSITLDLQQGFPLLTTKKMWWKGIVAETLWMLKGYSSLEFLHKHKVHIWDKDAYRFSKDGSVGRMYGVQWREYRTRNKNGAYKYEDQLSRVVWEIITNRNSSNLVIFGDNPADRKEQALPCCMPLMQFSTSEDKLNLTVNYRSWDVLLGCCWNTAQYALILTIISELTGNRAGELRINATNVHLYDNQLPAANEHWCRYTQPSKNPIKVGLNIHDILGLEKDYVLPIDQPHVIEDFWEIIQPSDITIKNYKPQGKLLKQPEMLTYTKKNN